MQIDGPPKLHQAWRMNPQQEITKIDDKFKAYGNTIARITGNGYLSINRGWIERRTTVDIACLYRHESSHIGSCSAAKHQRVEEYCALKIERECCKNRGCSPDRVSWLRQAEYDGAWK